MNLYAAATRAPEAFESVARTTGKGWLAALREGVDPTRRDALDAWLRMPRSIAELTAWIATEGREARWAVIQFCRNVIEELPRFGTYSAGAPMLFGRVIPSRPGVFAVEMPWLWIELLASVPGHKRLVAQDLVREALVFPDQILMPPVEHALRTWPPFPHRSMVARRFEASGRLGPDLAIRWLADPALRPIGERVLRDQVTNVEPALRDELAEASGGTREAIVRLLRTVDERMALDGKSEATDDAELQTRLRADPWDATTSMVWVDLLGTRGDPRGEHIALEHAIAAADPERALELSRAQAAVCNEYHKAIWNRPGGFPFREKYRGRELVAFGSDWNHKIRGKPATIVERVQKLVNHVTTVAAPVEVHIGRVRGRDPGAYTDASPVITATPVEIELLRVLGDAAMYQDGERRFARRADPEAPLVDADGFCDLCAAHRYLTIIYRFQLTWPGTRIPLPHQEGEHYSGAEPLVDRLAISLDENALDLHLRFPFEDFASDGFLAIYEAITSTLGRVLTASRFFTLASSADCKRMVSRLAKFSLR